MDMPWDPRIREIVRRQRVFSAEDAMAAGVRRDELRRLVAEGAVARIGRDLYAPPQSEWSEQDTLATVAACAPQGFCCLLTALRLHGLRDVRPTAIWFALDRRLTPPRIDFVPLRVVQTSGVALTIGVQEVEMAATRVRVTSPSRTVVDCFKFRNTVGPQTAIDALKALRRLGSIDEDEMWAQADALRMWNVMSPFRAWPS